MPKREREGNEWRHKNKTNNNNNLAERNKTCFWYEIYMLTTKPYKKFSPHLHLLLLSLSIIHTKCPLFIGFACEFKLLSRLFVVDVKTHLCVRINMPNMCRKRNDQFGFWAKHRMKSKICHYDHISSTCYLVNRCHLLINDSARTETKCKIENFWLNNNNWLNNNRY